MQSYNIYDIDFNKLATWLLPKQLRKAKLLLLAKSCIYPLISLHNNFLKYRKAKIYQLTITSQVCYLEQMLNDKYDFTLRRIEIKDGEWFQPWYISQEAENKPKYLFRASENQPQYVYTGGEAGEFKDDFVVVVLASISFSIPEMRSAIDSYRLFGTRYTIQTI